MNAFEWADARSVEDVTALSVKGSMIKAGGVDLVDLIKEGIAAPPRVINIRNIPGLNQITEDADGLKIGPLVTLTELSENAVVKEKYHALAEAAGRAATPHIRNMGTVAGNLLQRPRCWYFRNEQFHCRKKSGEKCYAQEGENQYHAIFANGLCAIVHPSACATTLIALNAKIELTGPKEKRVVALEQFIVSPMVNLHGENTIAPDEILTEIRIPKLAPGARSFYIKQAEMQSHDWPIAEVAAVLEMNGETCTKASIVLGSAAPTPRRATEAENSIRGKVVDEANARRAATAALRAATPLPQNGYKLAIFETIITRTLLGAAGKAAQA